MIQYQGGGKDVFSTETAPVQTPQQTQAPGTAVGGSQPKGYVPPAEIEYRKIEYGIKVGMNSAQEYTDDGSTDTRVGLHAGFFAEIFISKRLGLQPELQYSMQGGKDNSGTDKFDYINLPIMLKIYVIKRDFSIDVGLQPGYMMSAKISNYGDISDLIDNKFDLAIGVGASYKFANRFRVGLRYNFGTTKFVEELENRNRVSQLFVGVRF
jgi:opacity protein-like surface antigen